jgi:NCAIR mutase (PurE)-related protein
MPFLRIFAHSCRCVLKRKAGLKSALGHHHPPPIILGRAASTSSLSDILGSVKNGTLSLVDAEKLIIGSDSAASSSTKSTAEDTLQYFANLDHTRSFRTGFPEVVFAETKTPQQIAMILDDMARHVNELVDNTTADSQLPESTAILATRYVGWGW